MVRRTWILFVVALSALIVAPANAADERAAAEEAATRYVIAIESGRFTEAVGLATGAAASWVEYLMATQEAPASPATAVSCESAEFSSYYLVKVVSRNEDGAFSARYVKVARSADGVWRVADDGKRGRRWASDTYLPGVIFKEPQEMGGLRVSVAAILELPSEVKFDLVIENTLDREISIYPQAEAYYTVETTKLRKAYYYPVVVKNGIDGPVPPKSTKKGFILFPSFVRDFVAEDPTLEGLKWVLYIPFGVDRQFVFAR